MTAKKPKPETLTRFYNVNIPASLFDRVEAHRTAAGMTKEGVTVKALQALLKKGGRK